MSMSGALTPRRVVPPSAHKFLPYIKSGWNKLDFFIVCTSGTRPLSCLRPPHATLRPDAPCHAPSP